VISEAEKPVEAGRIESVCGDEGEDERAHAQTLSNGSARESAQNCDDRCLPE
jgi:hypothetical protein